VIAQKAFINWQASLYSNKVAFLFNKGDNEILVGAKGDVVI